MATFRRTATYRQSFLPDFLQEVEDRGKKDKPFDYNFSTGFKCSGFDKTGQYYTMLQKDPDPRPAVDTYDGPYFVEPETDELNMVHHMSLQLVLDLSVTWYDTDQFCQIQSI